MGSRDAAAACPTCGALVPADRGSCASCLLTLGLGPAAAGPAREPAEQRYEILETLGQGGMGTVYLAEQKEPLQRKVALKVIKPDAGEPADLLARFEVERQALALMDHPAIARVFDAGELPSGEPYFSMEYVDGLRVTDYADTHRLPTDDRLRLFATLCDGVQHAHQKGIIHRDLKPSNVLVSGSNGDASPKIIDFGIAKAVERGLTNESMVTQLGLAVGTPHYMSPEQASASPLGVDTRSDVYALGVLLYELLSGQLPFDDQGAQSNEELRRVIRDVEPATPSARITSAGENTDSIARCRAAAPSALQRKLAGDLDWITMKALEKEPSRRYQAVAELASDVRAYLADEPILARAPSAAYRLRKFARRHRTPVIAAGIALAGLVAFTITTAWQARALSIQRDLAEAERARAERAASFLADAIGRVEPDEMGLALWKDLEDEVADAERQRGGEESSVAQARADLKQMLAGVNSTNVAKRLLDRELLSVAGASLVSDLAEDPLTAARLELTLGQTYRDLSLYEQAKEHLERALELRERHLGHQDPATVEARQAVASLALVTARFDEANSGFEEVLDYRRTALGPEHPKTLETLQSVASLHVARGELEEAFAVQQQVLDARRRVLGDEHPDSLESLLALGSVYKEKGELEQAEAHLREAVDGMRRVHGQDGRKTLTALNNLAMVLDALSEDEEAEAIFRDMLAGFRNAYGDEHFLTLSAMNNFGAFLRSRGRFDESDPLYLEALETKRRVLGEGHPSTLVSLNNFGAMLRSRGRWPEAEEVFRECAEKRLALLGPHHQHTLTAESNHADALTRLGRLHESETILEAIVPRARESLGSEHLTTLGLLTRLAELREAQDRYAEAVTVYREVLDGFASAVGAEHPLTINAHNSLAWIHHNHGERKLAEQQYRDVLRLRRQTLPAGHKWISYALVGLGRNLCAQGRYREAEELLREAVNIRRDHHRDESWHLAESLVLLGHSLAAQKQWDEAEELLLEAAEGAELPTKGRINRRQELFDSLVLLYESWGKQTKARVWRSAAGKI